MTSAAWLDSATGRLRNPKVLAVWLAASIAVHVAILLVVPAMRVLERTPPEPLNVTLETVEPPRLIATPESVRSPPKDIPAKRTPRDERAKSPPALPAAPAETHRATPAPSPAPVLTMPEVPTLSVPGIPQSETPDRAARGPEMGQAEPGARAADSAPPAQAGEKSLETTPPSPVSQPTHYPLRARLRGEEGTVVLRILITAEGRVGRVAIVTPSGYPTLDAAAREQVKNWRWTPARRGGKPVEHEVVFPYNFELKSRP